MTGETRMIRRINSASLLVVLLCLVGCSKVDEVVLLGIVMENNDSLQKNQAKDANTGLKVFINGNFYDFIAGGYSGGGPIDRFLRPGSNVVELEGSTTNPVTINLVSFAADCRTENRGILKQRWHNIAADGKYQLTFKVNKKSLLPIFDKKNALPNRLRSEQEITTIVRNLYQDYVTSNKEDFVRTTLEGCKIYSPADYHSYMDDDTIGRAFHYFKLKPFPEKLYFIHGNNLVFVYSGNLSQNSLFENQIFLDSEGHEDPTKESCSVAGINFAYIEKRWVVW